jgi:hypothetical protein
LVSGQQDSFDVPLASTGATFLNTGELEPMNLYWRETESRVRKIVKNASWLAPAVP